MGLTIALDIDGTITAAPRQFAALARSVRAAPGGKVLIVHASGDKVPTTADYEEAREKLRAAGFAGLYDAIYCAPKPKAKNKARYCKAQGVDLFIDNNPKNCKAVAKAGVPAARFLAAK